MRSIVFMSPCAQQIPPLDRAHLPLLPDTVVSLLVVLDQQEHADSQCHSIDHGPPVADLHGVGGILYSFQVYRLSVEEGGDGEEEQDARDGEDGALSGRANE